VLAAVSLDVSQDLFESMLPAQRDAQVIRSGASKSGVLSVWGGRIPCSSEGKGSELTRVLKEVIKILEWLCVCEDEIKRDR
jgi:hypothetical protein